MAPGKRPLKSWNSEISRPSSSTAKSRQSMEIQNNATLSNASLRGTSQVTRSTSRNVMESTVIPRNQIPPVDGQPVALSNLHDGATHPEVSTADQTVGSDSNAIRKRRGKALNAKLTNHVLVTARPKIVIEKGMTRPIGPWAKEFIREVGIASREHMPYDCTSWYDIGDAHLLPIYAKIEDKFNIDLSGHVKEAVNLMIQQRFREHRAKLSQHFVRNGGNSDALRHPYDGVPHDDWETICKHFMSEKYKERRVVNSENRKKLLINHCAGSRCFIQHLDDLRNPSTDAPGSKIEMYKVVHFKKDKGWIHEEAREIYEAMVAARDEAADLSAQSEGVTVLSDDQIFSQFVGTRKGYARGLGYGVRPPPSSRLKANSDELEQTRRRAEEAEKNSEVLKNQIQSQEEKIDSQQEQILSQQELLAEMQARQMLMEEKMEAFMRSR